MSKGGSAPQPSAEERQLQAEQAATLQFQRKILASQMKTQDLLAPYLYKDLGLSPQYDANGNISGFTEVPDPNKEIQTNINQLTLAQLQQAQANAPQQNEIQNLLGQRTLAALKGELPVDPALIRTLDQQELDLRGRLAANLGPGYETSTPGSQALADFTKRKLELLDQARRGDLTLAEQLGQAQSGANVAAAQTGTDLLSRLTQSRISNLFGTSSYPSQVSAGLGQVVQGYGGTLAQLYNDRALQGQIAASNRAGQYQLLGTVLGAGVGAYGSYLGSQALGAALVASDRRLKTDMKKIGKTDTGIPIYTFRYKGMPNKHIGVMAQDVEKVNPRAVVKFGDIRFVDTRKL